MKFDKMIHKTGYALLCSLFSFLSGNVYSQLTYVSCNSACPSKLVGHVTFGNSAGTTTGSWNVNSLSYGGLGNESFTITDPAAYTYVSNGNLTTTGGGTYTIVNNPIAVKGPTG